MGKNLVEIIVTAEDKASGVLSGVGGALQGIGRVATTAALGGIAVVAGGFGIAARAAIGMNSTLETSTLQFTTLMGDSEKAEAKVASLFDFAAKTPFETGPIIEASRIMQVFGGDALNTDENLTRIGDTAAAVGAPIEDIGFWVGRAYAAIQGGQPFGEAAQNLMQMGAVSPQVIAEMNRLKEAGASSDEIFAVLQGHMDGFTGAMESQAGTWEGLKSTIIDNLNMAAATALKPFFDLVKTGMAAVAGWLQSPEVQAGIQSLVEGFTRLIERVSAFVTGQVIPFVTQHGEQLKAVLVAIGAIIVASMIPAAISLVVAMAPIILIVGAIVAAIWLLSSAWESNWGGIQEKTAAAWAVIQPLLQAAWEWLSVHVVAALEALRAFWVDTAWPAIQNAIAIVWPVIEAIFNSLKTWVIDTLIPTVENLYTKWTTVWWPTIQTVLQNVWTIIKEIFRVLVQWVEETIVPAVEELKRIWVDVVWPAIQGALEAAWAIIEPIWEAIRTWAAETLPPVLTALQGVWETVMGGIRSAIQPVKDVWDAFIGAVKTFWEWISSHTFDFHIGSPPDAPGAPAAPGGGREGASAVNGPVDRGGRAASRGGPDKVTVINIDARGSARGVEKDIRRVVEDVMRQYGTKADMRVRTS